MSINEMENARRQNMVKLSNDEEIITVIGHVLLFVLIGCIIRNALAPHEDADTTIPITVAY